MKRRPDWWSGVRSITQFSGYIDGGAHSAHTLHLHLALTGRLPRHTRKRWLTRRGDGKKTAEKLGLSELLSCNANANTHLAGLECLLMG